MTLAPVCVVLPALDEEDCVLGVVEGFRQQGVRSLVVDNGSEDRTFEVARNAKAEVIREPRRGYGRACLAGIRHLASNPPEIVVFADCDGSASADDIHMVLAPLREGTVDMVLGDPSGGSHHVVALHQRFGNLLVALLLLVIYGKRLCVTSPYRAIRWSVLAKLPLKEPAYGFPVESVCMALRAGARIVEVPIHSLPRSGGRSKVAGTFRGTLHAGLSMIRVVLSARIRWGRSCPSVS